MQYRLTTLAHHPELASHLSALEEEGLPPFMLKPSLVCARWERLLHCFPQYQLILLDEQDHVIAEGNTIPVAWNGKIQDLPAGLDAVLEQGVAEHMQNQSPTTLAAVAILIKPTFRGQAISSRMVEAMGQLAVASGLSPLIVPVRPNCKSRYPLISIEEYVSWMREDGLPFDPWIRTHVRLGARIMKIAQQSMVITGSIQEWEEWTAMRLSQSGSYIIPEGLVPLLISTEKNQGRYEEPNVWMVHPLSERRAPSF